MGGFLVLVALGGGTARADALSLLYVRPAAILTLVGLFLIDRDLASLPGRRVLYFIGAVFGLVIVQLVPLPPSLWTELPGRELALEGDRIAEIGLVWRPISLAPGATLNSLAALFVPLAALAGCLSLSQRGTFGLMMAILTLVGVSAVLGIVQVAGGPGSALRFYEVTNTDSAVGLFANRNHQALFLTFGFPILAELGRNIGARRGLKARDLAIGGFIIIFLVAAVFATGSRAGILLTLASLVLSIRIFGGPRLLSGRSLLIGAAALAAMVLALLAAGIGNSRALERLTENVVANDPRFVLIGDFDAMMADTFPFGTGLGSFRHVFPTYERAETMEPGYINHAHNDLLQAIIEGGLPALVLLLLFLYWFFRIARVIHGLKRGRDTNAAQVGMTCAILVLLASLFDFPLRAPFIAALFALFCGWMLRANRPYDTPKPPD